jgi:DNA-binding transcriptional regulator YiaG
MTPEQIKALRNKLGWSQPRLAKYLSTSVHTISQWETGHHKPDKRYNQRLERLAKRVS